MLFVNPTTLQPIAVLSPVRNICRYSKNRVSSYTSADPFVVKRWAAKKIENAINANCNVETYVKSYVACFYYQSEIANHTRAYECLSIALKAAALELPASIPAKDILERAIKHCDELHEHFRPDILRNFQSYSLRVEHQKQVFALPNNFNQAEVPLRHKLFASVNLSGTYSTCTQLFKDMKAPGRSLGSSTELLGKSTDVAAWLRKALLLASENTTTTFCVLSLVAQHNFWLKTGVIEKAQNALWEATFLAACCNGPVFAVEEALNNSVAAWYKAGYDIDQILENHRNHLVKLSKYDGGRLSQTLLDHLIGTHTKKTLHPEIKEWFQLHKARTYESLPQLQEIAHTYQSIKSTIGHCFEAFQRIEEIFLSEGEAFVDFHHEGSFIGKICFKILDATDESSRSMFFSRIGYLKNGRTDAPIYVDCNDYASGQFGPGPGAYAWILAGGVWICPSHDSIYGRSSDADNIVSCLRELKSRGFDCSSVVLGGSGINARIAARVALSEPSLVTELILENCVFEHGAHDPLVENFHTISSESPIDPDLLPQRVLLLASSSNLNHLANFTQDIKENLYVGQVSDFEHILDNALALAFAMHATGLVQKLDQASIQ